MYPHEVQALMAKLIFFIFALTLLCMGRVSAKTIDTYVSVQKTPLVKSVLH